MYKILVLNLPGNVMKAGSRWYNVIQNSATSLRYSPYPWFMGYLTSLLKKNNFEAKLIDAIAMEWNFERTLAFIKKFKPKYIICEPTWVSEESDKDFLSKIDKKIIKIAVGNYATNYPFNCLKKIPIDYVVIGEYEFSILDFVKSGNKIIPKNFVSKNKNSFDRSELVDLNLLPFPERNDTPIEYYNEPSCFGRNIVMVSSRGCRLKCSFCNVECIYGKHIYRTRNVNNVVDEMEYLKKNFKFDEIYFDDDNMVAKKEHIDGICKEIIRRRLKIKWLCMGDGLIDDQTLELLALAGCVTYKYGLEHLDEQVLKAIPKPLKRERLLEIIKKCKELRMRSYVNLIFGLPQSTFKKDYKMFQDVLKANPDLLQISIATPYPGTLFFQKAKANGWLISEDPSYFDATGKSAVSYPNYSAEEIQKMFNLGWKMWYKHVLFKKPKTLLFFVNSEIKRNGLLSTLNKMTSYSKKIIN